MFIFLLCVHFISSTQSELLREKEIEHNLFKLFLVLFFQFERLRISIWNEPNMKNECERMNGERLIYSPDNCGACV